MTDKYTLVDSIVNLFARFRRTHKQVISAAVDSVVILISLSLAYSMSQGYPLMDLTSTWYLFVIMVGVTVLLFRALGIYRWVIRSTNVKLMRQLVKGCLASALILLLIIEILPAAHFTSRSHIIAYAFLLLSGTCGLRMLWQKLVDDGNLGEFVAIYGAGRDGIQLMRLLAVGTEYCPVVFIDTNPNLQGSTVAGLPVIDSDPGSLRSALKERGVSRVILAIPSASNKQYQRIIGELETLGLVIQTIPSVSEVVTGKARALEVRDISIAEILGRNEVPPDMALMSRCIKGMVVLVTGGGGSIGSELCRQIIRLGAKKLLVCDHSEANLYQITEELNAMSDTLGLSPDVFEAVLCSVTDRAAMDRIMNDHQVHTVYHAAAYKHVPIVEAQPEQGVMVNVFGTRNTLEAAIAHNVSNFVLISTDKAVRSTNAMGASKRTAELILQAKAKHAGKTCISIVRFGNVLGSSGSVVPKFMAQIRKCGPITLTHPDITRYFMTIPEAAQLVLQASAIARGGDVFVLDMGEPIRIADLAKTMVRLCGKRLRSDTGNMSDIEVKIEGLRPGEKMYEELFISGKHESTEVKKIFTADEVMLDWNHLKPRLAELGELARTARRQELRSALLDLAYSAERELPTTQTTCTTELDESSLLPRSTTLPKPAALAD
ncbi:MAG: polysaccharide biosynthesis protein [Granulosicoccus sp.]|nr:polysaccharide biosynthesis protein [Granulosicoccus sp.]